MPKSFPVDFGKPLLIGDIFYPRVYMWIVIIAVSLLVLLHVFMKYTKSGLAMRAVAKSKDIAFLSGINVPLVMSLTFGNPFFRIPLVSKKELLIHTIKFMHKNPC